MTEVAIITLTILLCTAGIILSALSFSGTWVVLAAAAITRAMLTQPSWGVLIIFLVLCVITEVIEAVAGYHGVQKRGGSKMAGAGALIGGLIGAVAGSSVLPVIGTIAGMLVGSFGLAYVIEKSKVKHHEQAARVAMGAVWARLSVMFIKTFVTMVMTAWLLTLLLS
jgi:uncharacterized protein YqgC (DUF456 family)